MRFAYADPPYPGMAQRHYASEAAADGRTAREVNHALLVNHLCDEYPDGWVLSTSSPALRFVLSLCPDDVRVGAWVKPFAVFRPGVNPAYAWEPVVFRGGRKRTRDEATVRDWVSANITMQRGVAGAKPVEFTKWVVGLLGATADDTVDDLFPGSGAVQEVIEGWLRREVPCGPDRLFAEEAA